MSGPDVVVIGTGMGGATLAAGLAPSGARILILERGERLAPSPHTRDPFHVFHHGTFRAADRWLTPAGEAFSPGNYAMVGGNSKFYGGVMFRFREADFAPLRHLGGTTPGWPIPYAAFEPWYQRAEDLYQVRGSLGEDPTEPPHSGRYPHPPVPDEPDIAALRPALRRAGVHPASLPLGVDHVRWAAGGAGPWDGFPDTTGAKMEAESVGIAEALRHPNVTLATGAVVTRLVQGDGGSIVAVEYDEAGSHRRVEPRLVVLSAGAVNSAALLLRSADAAMPRGLANGSDLVGRNFMNHNCTAMLAIHPLRRNRAVYQKTLGFNDFYLTGGPGGEPLGNVQLLGKISGPILGSALRWPAPALAAVAGRSVDWYLMSEDLPDRESRVTLRGDRVVLDWRRSNWAAHEALIARVKAVLRRAGFPVLLARSFDRRTPSHQCGTLAFGKDPRKSVLDIWCRAHDHPNLFCVDAGFLPNSAAVNPALTIAAQALRVADRIRQAELA